MRIVILALILLCIATPSGAQPAPPQQTPPAADDSSSTAAPPPVDSCREKGMQQNLRGQTLADFVAVCHLEARLACLKEAIAKKLVGPDRGAFMKSCAM